MFTFQGAAVTLSAAPWKAQVGILYSVNSSGSGYVSYNPASLFNSLAQLVQDGFYILSTEQPGFDIEGALLTVQAPQSSFNLVDFGTVLTDESGIPALFSGKVLRGVTDKPIVLPTAAEPTTNWMIALAIPAEELNFSMLFSDELVLKLAIKDGQCTISAPLSADVNTVSCPAGPLLIVIRIRENDAVILVGGNEISMTPMQASIESLALLFEGPSASYIWGLDVFQNYGPDYTSFYSTFASFYSQYGLTLN